MSFINKKYAKSSWSLFVLILILGFVFIAIPEFAYFAINESLRGQLEWSEAFFAFLISCFGALIFAVIGWLLFESMRRRRELLKNKK
jgi:predicted MFS family arabinose efflux permease